MHQDTNMIRSSERIPVAGPWITDKEVSYVAEAARNGWYENHYIYNKRFEDRLRGLHRRTLRSSRAALYSGYPHFSCGAVSYRRILVIRRQRLELAI